MTTTNYAHWQKDIISHFRRSLAFVFSIIVLVFMRLSFIVYMFAIRSEKGAHDRIKDKCCYVLAETTLYIIYYEICTTVLMVTVSYY